MGTSHAQDSFRFRDNLKAMSAVQLVASTPVRLQNSQCPSKHFNMHMPEMRFVKAVMYAQLLPSQGGFQDPGGGNLWETQLRPPVRLKLSGTVNPKSASLFRLPFGRGLGVGPQAAQFLSQREQAVMLLAASGNVASGLGRTSRRFQKGILLPEPLSQEVAIDGAKHASARPLN